MEKNPSFKIYGVLGDPAKHSLSPLMHNAAFKALKINAEYKIFERKPEELDSFLCSLSEENIRGLNVTVPYKETVVKYLEEQSPEVKFTGAANTIEVKDNNYLKGWNTDGIGFYRHLTYDLKFNIEGKIAVILGAGGAAKAVTDQLARNKAKSITIYDIDKNKGLQLADKLRKEFPECKVIYADAVDKLNIKNADLLINATPIGMKESDPCLIDKSRIHKGLFVYDLIYKPVETKLLKLARDNGLQNSNGLGMLLYQGALSFQIWTGVKIAPIDIMRKALMEGLEK